ncbi:MAG: ABC transporter permease [Clostridia bacterium]|nr:ABC transporter permease [Clostridia bacterium]
MKKRINRGSVICLIAGVALLFTGIYGRANYLAQKSKVLAAMIEALEAGTATPYQKYLNFCYHAFWPLFLLGAALTLAGLALHICARVISNRRYPQNEDSTLRNVLFSRSFREDALDFLGDYMMFVIILLLMIVMSFAFPRFFTLSNFQNILNQIAIWGVMACGITFVLLTGNIDLTIGSILSLVGIICASLLRSTSSLLLCFLVPVLLGCLMGTFTGGVMAGINGRMGESFIVTYGGQSAIAALALLVQGGTYITLEAADLQNRGLGLFQKLGAGINPAYIFFGIIVICQLVLNYTKFGRNLMFVGSNPKAAQLSGINVRLYILLAFLICGGICGIAGVLQTSRVMTANPTAGTDYEMSAIAMCVVGGVSMKGGSGSFINTMLGVLIIGIITNSMNLLGYSTYPQMMIKGLVIIFAFGLDVINKNRKLKRG